MNPACTSPIKDKKRETPIMKESEIFVESDC